MEQRSQELQLAIRRSSAALTRRLPIALLYGWPRPAGVPITALISGRRLPCLSAPTSSYDRTGST